MRVNLKQKGREERRKDNALKEDRIKGKQKREKMIQQKRKKGGKEDRGECKELNDGRVRKPEKKTKRKILVKKEDKRRFEKVGDKETKGKHNEKK